MGSDDLFKKRKGNRRKKSIRARVPHRYLIVCEGKKTEPNYFEGIKRQLNQKYDDTVEVKTPIELDIQGTGRNTEDLVNFAKKQRSFSKIPCQIENFRYFGRTLSK